MKNAEKTEDIRTKGIKNIFIGIGLFIFLWAITENFGVGCVGLLMMFTGFGQLVSSSARWGDWCSAVLE